MFHTQDRALVKPLDLKLDDLITPFLQNTREVDTKSIAIALYTQ